MAQKLSNAYVDPSQPGSLGGVAKFAKAHGLTQSKARQVLETMLHKPQTSSISYFTCHGL